MCRVLIHFDFGISIYGYLISLLLLAASTAHCQDDISVVWLGRYPNSYIAGPVGNSEPCYPSCRYELSDTFQRKQIEILERKYGGHYRTNRAATIIQRRFRDYCLAKKWKQMCNPSRRRMHRIQNSELASPTRSTTTVSSGCLNHSSQLISSPPHSVENYESWSVRREMTVSPADRENERETTGLNNPPAGLRLHKYNVDKRPHLSAPLSAQLRVINGPNHMNAGVEATPRRMLHVQPTEHIYQDPVRKVPGVRVIAKPRSVSAERHRNHRMNNGRVRVIPVVAAPRDEVLRKPAILSQESDILPESSSPHHFPRFALDNLNASIGQTSRPLPSRPSDTSLLSQESQGSSNSGNSSSGYAGTAGGRVATDNWTADRSDLPSYLTYMEFKEATRSPRDVPRVKCQRSVAHLPISASTVLPSSAWTSGSELDTPSSDTGSSCSIGGLYSQYGRTEGLRSPRGAGNRGREVWIPRPGSVKVMETGPHVPLHVASSDGALANMKKHQQKFGSPVSAREKKRASPRCYNDIERKRQYRVALNFFNKKPDRGMQFLIDFGFVDSDPSAVAKFLMSRRGLSKQMIGEFLGNLQSPFNSAVLE